MVEQRKRSVYRLRQEHNSDLIRRMLAGEPLNTVDNRASWYPPRPIIKKDPAEMARVYENATATSPATTPNGQGDGSIGIVPQRRMNNAG